MLFGTIGLRNSVDVFFMMLLLMYQPAAALNVKVGASTSSATALNPYSTVTAVANGQAGVTTEEAGTSRKYLISSFPNLKQVAYCILPDNVWRPLVVGDVTNPQGVAVDVPQSRLYVADPTLGKIFWYNLAIRSDGKLMTGAQQFVAVEGWTVSWMTVDGTSDLYFTGHAVVPAPQSTYDSVWRQDAQKIAMGNTLSPVEVYSRSNTGNPNPKVWLPSGIAVDSFSIYWGNQELGTTHGSVCAGSRQNIGLQSSEMSITALSTAQAEVRGLMSTGTNLYFLTTNGVFGIPKTQATTVTGAYDGLVAGPPSADTNGQAFDPKSIAWDGDGTGYISDFTTGVVYSIPAMDTRQHNLTKFVDAPGVYGMAVANFIESSATSLSPLLSVAFVLLLATAL